MKYSRGKTRCGLIRPIMLLAGALLAATALLADETTPLLDLPPLGATTAGVTESWGVPAFEAASILMYQVGISTASVPLVADLTFWFQADRLFYASYAFHLPEDGAVGLRDHFQAVSEMLIGIHGEPSSRALEEGVFTTEVWNLQAADIEHTVLLEPARADHTVTFTAPQ